MTSVKEVNPGVRGIRAPLNLQSLAARITKEISQGAKKPFKKVIDISTADPHRVGMSPVTFVRQVLAACLYPELFTEEIFPLDVRHRAQELLGACYGGSVGSYSVTPSGLPHVKKSIAEFIMRRDGGARGGGLRLKVDWRRVLARFPFYTQRIEVKCARSLDQPEPGLNGGANVKTAWTMILYLMASGEGETRTGVLIPVPCPHTLPMLLDDVGVAVVPYHLEENRGWALDPKELHRVLMTARGRCKPRAIYISNPGNPTGHVQDRKTIEEVIRFAAAEGLVLMADEIYQDSMYGQDKEFLSYRKVLFEMEKKYSETVELLSFNSISTASIGECGLRGAYMEVINMDQQVDTWFKNLQASGSPPVLGQLTLEIMVNPPTLGDPSYETYSEEILHTRTTLSNNAQRACEFLNDLPGMTCQPAMAGVFVYPCVDLPPQMIEEAKMLGVGADLLYCQRLLEEEGVCLGAGCENGQEDQNYHIRLCILAPYVTLEEVLARLRSFHLRMWDKYPWHKC